MYLGVRTNMDVSCGESEFRSNRIRWCTEASEGAEGFYADKRIDRFEFIQNDRTGAEVPPVRKSLFWLTLQVRHNVFHRGC